MLLFGGPFDGAKGLVFGMSDENPLPNEIEVGRCPGNGGCGMRNCEKVAVAHVAYWVPELEKAPVETIGYVKDSEQPPGEDDRGRAAYVLAGLDTSGPVEERELVGAGA